MAAGLIFVLFLADTNAGVELLAKAARAGNVKAAEDLLDAGVNPNLPDQSGSTALSYAASTNRADIVRVLLRYHADPNAPANRSRSTPLQYAAEFGDVQMSSMLIGAGADVNARGNKGKTALHSAGYRLDMMRSLIDKGADVNLRDEEGDSPLDEAVWIGALDGTAILLAHGARLNEAQSVSGATPINEAAYRGHADVVRYLLQFHPDLSIPDKRGYGPLDNAIRMGKEDCALLLIDQTASLDRAMDAAIRRKQARVVESLLQHGANVDALNTAASTGSAALVNVLLEHGANANSPGALEDAALRGYDSVVVALLDHGASVNQIDVASGSTALYAAASFGKASTVQILLKRGADPGLCSKNRKSPHQAAIENGFPEVASQLRAGCK